MALSAGEHQARRRRRSTTAPRRRIVSDPSITPIIRRPSFPRNLPTRRRTSTSPIRSHTSSPVLSSTTSESSPSTPVVAFSALQRSTLPRPYRDFSHFFQAMCPALRNRILGQVDWASLHGGPYWRSQCYQPWHASDSCKTAFIIHAEGNFPKACGRPAEREEEEEGRSKGDGKKNPLATGKPSEATCANSTSSSKGYGCYRCHTVKPEAAFEKLPDYFVVSSSGCIVGRYAGKAADGDKEQSRLPTLRSGEGLLRRFCIECGVRDGLYEKRKLITSLTEERWSICDCRRLHWVPSNESYIECEHCLVKSAFRPPV
ncbi:hypothetical protein CORC01_04745 [Colletotrichum orchidophilum]|uniref:Uncharacterized protein n=1 Tax=Colletotrichum orchidophilum TaxID=1209926 RepID=A0A1G4BEH6_9PEZI|nr:uncharacterized protein CORC01_04745 [Colletotrichum orchidophilum]OHE99844.1 hypothetical protein CORC01_04745 [Colletotrichum orchidophilum]